MRRKNILLLGVVVLFLVCPLAAGAEPVPWSSTSYYEIYLYQAEFEWPIIKRSPPYSLPLSESIRDGEFGLTVTADTGYLYAYAKGGSSLDARAYFDGNFVANQPFFILDYSAYAYEGAPWYLGDVYISVRNATTNTLLYSFDSDTSSLFQNTININTPVGDTISVLFWTQARTEGEMSLTYSTAAVVPEPISSILFVTGGAILAGKSYIKRRRKA